MSYPSVPIAYKSTRTPVKGTKVDMAINGTVRGRNFHTQTTYNFNLVHEYCTSAEMQSIIDCYTSVGASTVNMTWDGDGAVYSVIFTVEPTVQPVYDALYNVTSRLTGRAA